MEETRMEGQPNGHPAGSCAKELDEKNAKSKRIDDGHKGRKERRRDDGTRAFT